MDKKKVLIVEDDIIIQKLIQLRLIHLGYDVCGMAETSPDAISIAHNTNPDFILMDINLDGKIDGVETARLIKAYLNSRIIFLTGLTDDGVIDRVKDIHPDGYILKPFSDNDLRIALELAK